VGLGTIGGSAIILWYDGVAPRLSAKHPTKHEEYLRLPLVCAGGPVYVLSMLWLGWTARADIHWFVPLSSMVPYGLSYHLIYVAIINVREPPPAPASLPTHPHVSPPMVISTLLLTKSTPPTHSTSPTPTASTQPRRSPQ
jgi:hypothetical protein